MAGRINHEGHYDDLATKVTKNTKTFYTEQRSNDDERRAVRRAAEGGSRSTRDAGNKRV